MTYKTEFPHYAGPIPDVFLSAPWTDESWCNDACPSFARRMADGREIHVYVDEDSPADREVWTHPDGKQTPCPRYSVRITDDDGCFFDDENLSFFSDSLADVLDRVGFLMGEVAR